MNLDTKVKVVVVFGLMVAAFAFGRYSIKTVVKTEESKTEVQKQVDKDVKKKSTIVSTKKPDGEVVTTTVIEEETVSKSNTAKSTEISKSETVTGKASTTNISALIGTSVITPLSGPVYGVSVTKEVLGPVTIGVFGLNTGVVGASVGISF